MSWRTRVTYLQSFPTLICQSLQLGLSLPHAKGPCECLGRPCIDQGHDFLQPRVLLSLSCKSAARISAFIVWRVCLDSVQS